MKKNLRKYIGGALLIVALLCIGYVVYYETTKVDNENVYATMQSKVAQDLKDLEIGTRYICPIDFEELWKVNTDIYAWIEIPDTSISYPIVQSDTDNAYYLNHTIEGQEGYPGSIYTENYNAKDFTDYNTVVYGHNMKDGSMFQGLHEYEDSQYLKEHPYVTIYTPEQRLEYQIFAAVAYSDIHILDGYDFSAKEQRQLYLDSIYASRNMSSSFDESVNVSADDKILTLSTCIGGEPDRRLLVEAVLIEEE